MTHYRNVLQRTASALLFVAFVSSPSAATGNSDGTVEIDHIEPVGNLYTQIVAVESNGVRTLYVSGQVGRGETLEEQSKAAFGNLRRRIEAAGASINDIVKLVTYVVDWNSGKADAAFAGFYEIYAGDALTPAHTLVGVQALYSPHALLEVEAVVVVAARD